MDLKKIKKRAVCSQGGITLYEEERELVSFSPSEMLFWSAKRPWEAGTHNWIMAAAEPEEDRSRKPEQEGLQNRDNGISQEPDQGDIRILLRDGPVEALLKLSPVKRGLKVSLAFKNRGTEDIRQFAGGIRFPVTGAGEGKRDRRKATLPHVIYNDNPSSDPDRVVPHIGKRPGEGILVEEHRLPIPAVNLEWREDGGFYFLSLFSLPEVKTGEDEDYWSLGILKESNGEALTAMSGTLMFEGVKDVVYGGRCTPLPYFGGYRTLRPGEETGREFLLNWGGLSCEGRGFRDLADTGFHLYKPSAEEKLTVAEMIDLKKKAMDSRWFDDGRACGYLTFGSANSFGNISGRPEYILYGWTGQALKLAWCDCLLGIRTAESWRLKRGMRAAGFFLKNASAGEEGLWNGYYLTNEKEWRGAVKSKEAPISSRIFGESAGDILDLMCLLRKNRVEIPKGWEGPVRRALDFLCRPERRTPDGVFPYAWRPDGTMPDTRLNASGMSCVLALALGYEYFGCQGLLEEACALYDKYAHFHMDTFEFPFAKATMDARCEDKEAGIYFFLAAKKLYELTDLERYREWAGVCADWLLTFVFFWETGFRAGTICREKRFCTTGWPGVSVQNHHLDVFFPSYELFDFGRQTGEERFARMGTAVRNAMTNGVCTKKGEWGFDIPGEQGEHYYHTNYFQSRYPGILKHTSEWRGGMNRWNPSWITAQVLSANLKFYDNGDDEKEDSFDNRK